MPYSSIKVAVAILFASLCLTGCLLSVPHYTNPTPFETEYPEIEERNELMYLGFSLLDSNERGGFITNVRSHDLKKYKTFYASLDKFYSDYGRNQELLKFLGDDDFSTNALLATGFIYAADGLLELFSEDGDFDHVSSFFLPSLIGNTKLETPEDARLFAKNYLKERLISWSKLVGRKIECHRFCDSYAPTYRIYEEGVDINDEYEHKKEHEFKNPPIYNPPNIYVAYYIRPMIEAPIDPTRDRILGFAARWVSRSVDGAPIAWGQILRSEVGEEQFYDLDSEARMPYMQFGMSVPAIYTDMLTSLSGEEGYYLLARDTSNRFLVYKNKHYKICTFCSGERMILSRYILENSNLLIRSK